MTRRWAFWALLIVAFIAFSIAGLLLIPACAIAHFTGSWDVGCSTTLDDVEEERARLEARARDLQIRIDGLEARLAAQRCTADQPLVLPDALRDERGDLLTPPDERGDGLFDRADDPARRDALLEPDTPLPDGDALPDTEDALRDLDADEVAPESDMPRDMASLDGCWSLESDLEIRTIGSGDTRPLPEWDVCFEEGDGGAGTQVMRSDDGMLCEGAIQGSFNDEGALVLEEDEDLVCNDGTEIFKRTTTCSVGEDGLATCEAVQPRTGGRGTFALRRN